MGLRSWLIHRLGGYTYEDVYGCNESTDYEYTDLTELSKMEQCASFIKSNLQTNQVSILAVRSPTLPQTQLVSTVNDLAQSQFAASQTIQWQGQVAMSPKDLRAACQSKQALL